MDTYGNPGYVWVFTNFEETLYRYSPTRDGALVRTILDGFSGVLVSDFYSVYDSMGCRQQKCLAHLTRDINDSLRENPFDDELAQLASQFTTLMAQIVETIDRFGLKPYFLKRHQGSASAFLEKVCNEQFASTAATELQGRFKKYGARMFTFLESEGVTWNNNAAENAIKLFASRWRLMGATHTEVSIRDYLLFLGIYATLRRKGGNLLRFLLSREKDIDEFLKK